MYYHYTHHNHGAWRTIGVQVEIVHADAYQRALHKISIRGGGNEDTYP